MGDAHRGDVSLTARIGRLAAVAHTDDPNVAARIAVTTKTWPTNQENNTRHDSPAVTVHRRFHRPGGGTGRRQRWETVPVMIITEPVDAVTDDDLTFTVPVGVDVCDDIDPGAAAAVTVADTWGWVDIEHVGRHCDDCNGHGSYNIGGLD